ncbi:MAG TPA: hypothetical protein VFS00_28650, partial [Polyangiaceae bacterium]|nr:hypothetical protein [Polyangiaceae bacterium]
MSATAAKPAAIDRKGSEIPANAAPAVVPDMGGVVGFSGNRRVPKPVNEPVRMYAPGSPERAALKS